MRTCPVCHSSCFEDMDVCFGCMYHFDRDVPEPDGSEYAPEASPVESHACVAVDPAPAAVPWELAPSVARPPSARILRTAGQARPSHALSRRRSAFALERRAAGPVDLASGACVQVGDGQNRYQLVISVEPVGGFA